MALFTPSESPAVVVKEVDLTGGVPNVQSTTGAYVGQFRWGPTNQRTAISSEAQLVDTFATPDSSNALDFHTASYFLRYSNSMQVVRALHDSDQNARSLQQNGNGWFYPDSDNSINNYDLNVTVQNKNDFETQQASLGIRHTFLARYPGSLGNSLLVSMCGPDRGDSANTVGTAGFARPFNGIVDSDAWTYKSAFDVKPGTSAYATSKGSTNDEVHLAVIDNGGEISGTKGTILETYPNVSVAKDAKNDDGTSNYVAEVVNNRSEYIWMTGHDDSCTIHGQNTETGRDFNPTNASSLNTQDFAFDSGASNTTILANYLIGFDQFNDKDQVEVDFLIAPSFVTDTDQKTMINDLTSITAARKDCVVAASPSRNAVLGSASAATITTNITTAVDTLTRSSYLVMDGNFLKVYDKYNDKYIKIPASSSTAGIMAATDLNRAAWFSPAGSKRGNYLGITSLVWSPDKAQRDSLYKAGVNPIANIPGAGPVLFGDKTFLTTQSAFNRINVRRLFLVLERAIAKAAESVLFEFNDEFTRAEFVNIIEPVLREVKGRRGITDFRVVADETNNTAAVIDRNEFIANIFIKPARSINYVTLNFVAVRTGVDFSEVVGTV